jgi:predicted RNA-binding Zn ribbon-like protein
MSASDLDRLPLRGGLLCLDFVNSIDPRYGPERIEYVADYPGLVAWTIRVGALAPEHREPLLRAAAQDPRDSEAVHRRALALRDNLYALLRPGRGDAGSLDAFNRELRRASRHVRVEFAEPDFTAAWDAGDELDRVLWPVVRSATELMLDARALARVKECDGHDCGWLFLDTSKAGRRRWCSMEICGNRAKARRHRRRRAVDR